MSNITNLGASLYNKIRNEARRRGRDPQAEAQSYAIRVFMKRLMHVDLEGRATVKGGQALGLLFGNDRRPTKDLDLNVDSVGVEKRDDWVRGLLEAACLDQNDGVAYSLAEIALEDRIHQGAGGFRTKIKSSIHTCRTDFVVDVGMTETLKFESISLPVDDTLVRARSNIRVFPIEAQFAEKLISKFEDGSASIRHKDFYDLWHIYTIVNKIGDLGHMTSPRFDISDEEIAWRDGVILSIRAGDFVSLPNVVVPDESLDMFGRAISRVLAVRKTEMPEDVMHFLRREFVEQGNQSAQYANWIKNQQARLVNLPTGSDQKEAALGILLDELAPFVSEVTRRARCFDWSNEVEHTVGPIMRLGR